MPPIRISDFSNSDLPSILSLLAESMSSDPISEQRFTRQVLLDPNFRPEGAPIATLDDKIVGFCLSIARQVPLENAPSDADRGYITLFAVSPAHRRQRIGSQLLARAEQYLRSQNRKQIMISSYAPGYFIPGVDVRAYEPALAFFSKQGYTEVYRPLAMQTDLWNFSTPDWVNQKEQTLASQGIRIDNFHPALTLPILDFVQREFPGDWVRVVRETVSRILAGESPTRLIAAVDADGKVLAFCHYELERFGPIGVAAAQRGRCLGQILMYKTLQAQRQSGLRAAWFLWSDDKTAARLYTNAGFKETRRFALLRKQLV